MSLVSIEAEQSVIGACMLNNRVVDTLSGKLSAEHFAEPSHAVIWRTIMKLSASNTPLDVVTISEAMEDDGKLGEIGGLAYLAEIARHTPNWNNAEAYADIVIDLFRRRNLLKITQDLSGMTDDKSMTIHDLVDSAQGKISGILSTQDYTVGPIGGYLGGFLDDLDSKWAGDVSPMGVSFGVKDLDSLTMGMHPDNLVIAGARPKMGKTLFALNALRACVITNKRPAVMFSMEMSKEALLRRLAAAIAQVPQDAIKDPKSHMKDEHWPRLTLVVDALKEAPMVIDDRPALRPSQVKGAAKRWKDHYGDMGLVIVDYIGLMKPDEKHGTREREVAEISGAMKSLAKELKCPVLALSQLNRSLEQRPNKRPMMSDLRESGSLEQDADLIIFLYADEQYNPETRWKGVMELIVSAQRDGRTGTVYAARRLPEARIDDIDPESIAHLHEDDSKPKKKGSALDDL